MNQKRLIQRVVLWGCLLIVLCGIILLRLKPGVLTLINEAGESVIKTTVEINGAKFDFADIPPGGTRIIKYKIKGATHYAVSVEFHYERKLEGQAGFIIDWGKSGNQLIIRHDGVVLESGAIENRGDVFAAYGVPELIARMMPINGV